MLQPSWPSVDRFPRRLTSPQVRRRVDAAQRRGLRAAVTVAAAATAFSGVVPICDPPEGRDPGPLLRRADAALYEAKRAGRNRVAADHLSVAMQRETLAAAG